MELKNNLFQVYRESSKAKFRKIFVVLLQVNINFKFQSVHYMRLLLVKLS